MQRVAFIVIVLKNLCRPPPPPQEVEVVALRSDSTLESGIRKVPSGNNAARDVSAHVCMAGMHEAEVGGGLSAVM